MAFPLFTLIWAMNVRRAPERLQVRANRLWIWAIITQPVFSLVFAGHQPWWALNILFVFAGVTQLLALQYRFGRKGSVRRTQKHFAGSENISVNSITERVLDDALSSIVCRIMAIFS